MSQPNTPTGKTTVGREMRRFAVEALCLLMLLYGAPLQALEGALPEVEVDTPSLLSEVDAALDSARRGLQKGFQTAWQAGGDVTSNVAQQPWADALPLMLTASSFGITQETSSPPSPPSDERSAKDYDLASLAKGFPNKDALDAIQLLPGWNQISLPEVPGTPNPGDSDPATVLAAVGGSYTKVYAFDGCDDADPWKVYDPADPASSDLTSIGVTQGLLVDATAAVELPSDGTLPDSTTIPLCTGWNLIGFPSAQPRHVRSALAPILDKVVRVFGFDPFDIDDPWAFFEKDAPAWASDLDTLEPGQGYWVLVTEDVTLEIKNVGEAPDIAFTSPVDLDVVTAPTEIHGSVASDLLESWQLRYRSVGEADWVDLAGGNFPVNGKLGDFDPTLLLNGMYELELTATDLQGLQVTDSIAVVVEGNMKIGHFTLSFMDLAIPLSGLDIEVVRTYDSRQRHLQGDFGYGWSLDIRQGSYRNNRPPGDGWQIRATEGPWGLPCSPDAVLETKSHLTTIRLSDQEVYRFKLVVEDPGTIIGGCIGRADFEFVDGPIPGATLEILGNTSVLYQNNSFELRDPDTFALYEPEDVKLTTRDGRIFHLDLADGVTHLEDLNGNTLDITPEGITHSSGRGVQFERGTEGRIERIIDPMGNDNVYAYDSSGDHVAFTDRIGAETRFAYTDGHYLEDIVNALGVQAVRTEYDDDGRMVRMIDAAGKVTSFAHDLDNRREVVTNRLGFTRILEYDARGNLSKEIDEAGAVFERTFDNRNRLLMEKDPLHRVTRRTYNAAGDLLSLIDPLGNKTHFSYDGQGNLLTLTDARGHITTSTYDGRRNIVTSTDPLDQTSQFTHDSAGNLLAATDALGHTTKYSYSVQGDLLTETDPLENVTFYSYDENGNRLSEHQTRTLPNGSSETITIYNTYDSIGRLISVTAADGSTQQTSFDALGRATTFTDELGRKTKMLFDDRGRLVETVFPDGTSTQQTYDEEGRLLTRIDRAGRVTSMAYDPTGRLLSTTYPDGAILSKTYDLAGQRVKDHDALGNTKTYSYDSAGRQIKITDALGSQITFSYDANGNQTSVTNPRGHATVYTYDDLSRLIKATYDDGTTTQVVYDAIGRRIRKTDQAGIQTHYAYDPMGRLVSITDALNYITSFAYDEVGNRISQTDARGNTTRFAYDPIGRQTARTLPDGTLESVMYNADSTLASHTNFAGETLSFQYDSSQRLVSRLYPDGTEHSFTYTASGQRQTATDPRGTTLFTYDLRDRLVAKQDPNGHRLDYSYDLQGNLTGLTAKVGDASYTSSYEHDPLNRPIVVTDPQGGVSRVSYDSNGNRSSLQHPNGLTTSYSYDSFNRLTLLETTDEATQVVQSYAYTLNPSGHRTRVVEANGKVRSYSYDALYRLSQEQVSDSLGNLQYQRDFAYDAVGNRLSETLNEGGGPITNQATFDLRDRLLESGPLNYNWDSNGRLINQGNRSLSWDFDDRLSLVTLEDGTTIETDYDVDGNRVETRQTRPDMATEVTYHLVDSRNPLSHVVADIEDSTVKTLYARTDDEVLSLYRPQANQTKYFHADGNGSIRLLSNETAEITDRFEYTAFGQQIDHQGTDPQPYRFVGEPRDPNTGFFFLRARWLDVGSGRFISQDPFLGRPADPISLHRYLYTAANPVNLLDPSGRDFNLSTALTVVDITFTLVSIGLGVKSLIEGDYRQAAIEFTSVAFWGFVGLRKIGSIGSWWMRGRRTRTIYNNSVRSMSSVRSEYQLLDKSQRELAERLVSMRNEAKVAARRLMDPEDVAKLEKRNLDKYGDKIGPSVDWMLNNGKNLDEIIESAFDTNFWYNLFFLSF